MTASCLAGTTTAPIASIGAIGQRLCAPMISPVFRRAAHQALDLLIDAWAEESRKPPPRKRARGAAPRPAKQLPADVTAEELERAREMWSRAGYRKAG